MSYATTQDLIDRFGEAEMIRLTTPSDLPMDAIDTRRTERALEEASGRIDTYLRKRYQVPLDVAPAEIVGACCALARYDLAHGDGREPTEQQRLARKEAIDWLETIARGVVLLDGAMPSGDASYARMQDRDTRPGGGRQWP